MKTDLLQVSGTGTRQRSNGLRRALFVVLLLSLVLPGLASGFALIYLNLQRSLDVDTRVRAEKFADLLQAGLTLPLWEMAPGTGQPLLDAVATDPSVTDIEVRDQNARVLLGFHRTSDSSSDSIVVTRQITNEREQLGQIILSYSTSSAVGEANRASMRLLAIIAIQLLVSLGLIGAWLTHRVLKPLDVLRVSAERISAGDLQMAVPELREDEFGILSDQFETMRNSLAQSVNQLEERVEARTRELNDSNARLESTLSDLRRTQGILVQSEKLASLGALVAGVAHELNTPIGSGVTLVSTISDRCHELQAQIMAGIRRSQLDEFLRDVEEASALARSCLERAASLVQDFKQVAVDQTSSRRRSFELAEIVREMMIALEFRYKRSPARIEIHVANGIEMDSFPGALEQVIANLVENAAIHGFADRNAGTISIAAQASEKRVIVFVADNGNGIPSENIEKIFDPFFTTRLGKGGSGLGLSIAYGLVSGLLGGRISVASTLGQGSTFTLDLPLVAPEHPELSKD